MEKKEAGLKQMLSTVQKDKHKIESTIVSLDNYKKEALAVTWEKVNKQVHLTDLLVAWYTCF